MNPNTAADRRAGESTTDTERLGSAARRNKEDCPGHLAVESGEKADSGRTSLRLAADDEDGGHGHSSMRRSTMSRLGEEHVEPSLVRVIGPRQPGSIERLREAFAARQLILFFGLLGLRRLYQRTVLGWWWIPLRPLVEVGSRVFVFGSLLGSPSGGIPYLLFFFFGFSAWQLFQMTVIWSGRTAQVTRRIVSRIYVPRITALLGVATVPALVNLVLYLTMAGVTAVIFLVVGTPTGIELGGGLLYLLAGLALLLILGLSVGLWLSVLAAAARDPRYIASYVLRFLFFVSPVLYPLQRVPEDLKTLVTYNPVTAPLELVRMGIFDYGRVPTEALISTFGAILLIGVPGLRFFNRAEARALDAT